MTKSNSDELKCIIMQLKKEKKNELQNWNQYMSIETCHVRQLRTKEITRWLMVREGELIKRLLTMVEESNIRFGEYSQWLKGSWPTTISQLSLYSWCSPFKKSSFRKEGIEPVLNGEIIDGSNLRHQLSYTSIYALESKILN